MDELIKNLGAFWGPAGVICGLQFGAIVYLYRAREADQKAHDAALRASTDDNTETLKLVIPLVQKLTATIDVTLPVLMSKIHGGDR